MAMMVKIYDGDDILYLAERGTTTDPWQAKAYEDEVYADRDAAKRLGIDSRGMAEKPDGNVINVVVVEHARYFTPRKRDAEFA